MNKNNSKNAARKNSLFVVIANNENGKIVYTNIVYQVSTTDEGWNFIRENYTKSVPAFVKSYNELVTAGVSPEKLNSFKNPKIY
jgi:hypothetical protein